MYKTDTMIKKSDLNKLRSSVSEAPFVRLEFGCGDRKRDPESIGIDLRDFSGVDYTLDAIVALQALPNCAVDEIYSAHFVEHLADLDLFFREAFRVLKIGGKIETIAPHFSNPFFYSDPTHNKFFGLYTFLYFAHSHAYRRKIPRYSKVKGAEIVEIELVFKSYKPNYIRHGFKRGLQVLVNSTVFTQEYYEEMLCWLFPCYEVRCVMTRHD